MYYGAALDMEIKATLACNNAVAHADPVDRGRDRHDAADGLAAAAAAVEPGRTRRRVALGLSRRARARR